MWPFLFSTMLLGLLDQMQIFWQLYLIELLEVLIGLGLLKLQHLIYSKLLTGFSMLPNGHSHYIRIISICRRPNFDELPRHFYILFRCNFVDQKIHVVSTFFFQCNFDGQKIRVVSTHFFQCNFDGRKIRVVSTYFLRYNFDGRKIHLASTYFFRCNFFSSKYPQCYYLLFSK